MARLQLVSIGALLICSVAAPHVRAQQASGIAGVVRDTSGAVLPGVTVEASSPALIEKVRTVVSDSQGAYNVADMPLGTYRVMFGLSGFKTLVREGIVLTAAFTATVNVELELGALEETITVSGASPLVDTRNTRQQNVVSDDLLTSLPTSTQSATAIGALIPGLRVSADVGGSGGVYATGGFQSSTNVTGFQPLGGTRIHGKGGVNKTTFDGMQISNMQGNGNVGYVLNAVAVQEITVDTGGVSAESQAGGMQTNLVPKEGGNAFRFVTEGLFSNDHLQSDNLTDELRAMGVTTSAKVIKIYDANVAFGGPIKRDMLWFFTAHRAWGNSNQVPGRFWNQTQSTPFYTPDPTRPYVRPEDANSHVIRLTWQASRRNKMNVFADFQRNITGGSTGFIAPEATNTRWNFWPQGVFQATWNMPVTNRFLLEAGASMAMSHWDSPPQPGVKPTDISIVETSTGFEYNARAAITTGASTNYGVFLSDRYSQRFGASFITGSHSLKAGFQLNEGTRDLESFINGAVQYRFLNGIPASLRQFATPYRAIETLKADLGVFFQDQWIINRLALNYGLRFEYVNAYVPEQHLAAGPWVPARNYASLYSVPDRTDLNPRLGASYDLFGTGKTALKASLGRYVNPAGLNLTGLINPVVTSVNQVDRSWTDRNGNYVPDCDLRNPSEHDECGALANQNFGNSAPQLTRYADDSIHGFGTRDYFWDLGAEVQHQLLDRTSVTVGYYRNWYGNFLRSDNLAVTPTDYDPYCITAPVDGRLPGGGAYPVCGLYDINPSKFGKVDELVTQASHYGEQTQVSNFFAIGFNTQIGSTVRLAGGFDTGRSVLDSCFVIDSPQDLLYCSNHRPFRESTQIKLNGTYQLPWEFEVSGVLQNLPGLEILANYPAPNALIVPSLGRSLAGGARTAQVPLIEPGTQFTARRTQLDLRLSKTFRFGPTVRVRATVDAYNATNASSILAVNNTYGPQWQTPTSILTGRMVQFSGRLTF